MTSIKKKDKNPPFRAVLLPLGTDAANRNRYQKFTSHILNFYIYSNRGEEQLRSQILLDAGCKRSSNLDFVNPEKLDAIFLSHSHFDHTRFIGLLIRHLKKTGRVRELPLVCHPNAWKRVKWIIKAFNFSIPEFLQYIPVNLQIFAPCLNSRTKESQTDFSQTVDLTNLPLGKELEVKSKAAPAKHSKNSVAYRFWVFSNRKDNRKTKSLCLDLVFTPDTSFQSTHLVSFAKNATHWMLDCTRQPDFIENTYQKYLKGERGGRIPGHSSPYHSGKLCEDAKVVHFIAIHYFWKRFADVHDEVEENIFAQAKKTFSGEVTVSFDLNSIPLKLSDCSDLELK